MSTRCNIGFLNPEKPDPDKPVVLLYRHSDGYPDSEAGVEAVMREFFPKFLAERGADDTEYISAQLLAHMIGAHSAWARGLDNEDSRRTWEFLGYGICEKQRFHGDIEYYYAVSPVMLPKKERDFIRRASGIKVDVYGAVPFGKEGKFATRKPLHTWTFEAEKENAS